MPDTRAIAFVAMKFGGAHWKDLRYQAIRDVLDSAGFDCLRGDEIRSGGAVVDEVCRLLRDADLVIVDTSDDSHSVSYELGYCHGIGRPASRTLLVSRASDLPFNYRHYRVRRYTDTRSLKRTVRDFLGMSEPLRDDQYGYTFTFKYSETAHFGYILDGAEAVLDAIADTSFSGRLECFAGELHFGAYRTFAVSVVGRKRVGGARLNYAYWQRVMKSLPANLTRHAGRVELEPDTCEVASKAAAKATLEYCGAAEYSDGEIVRVIDSPDGETFFDSYLDRKRTEA